MTDNLGAILEYVDALRALDTSAVEPMTHAVPFDCPTRADEVRAVAAARRRAGERPAARRQLLPGAAHRPRSGRRRRIGRRGGRLVTIDARGATAVAIADGVRAGQVARARRRRAVPRSHRPPRRRARLLPAGRRRRRAAARRRRRRRAQGGPRSGRARRRPAGHQGHLLHARGRDDVRVEDPARLRAALRIDRDRAPGRGGRRDARQAQHGRVRDGLVEREQRVQAGAQPVVARARARRIVGRLAAAAAAASLCAGAIGTDTGGSIRQPAALCGVVGVKPTYGRVSRYGVIAFASSLDHPGPFGRTVEDAAALLEVMAGPDPLRRDQHPAAGGRLSRGGARGPRRARRRSAGVRLGVPDEYFQPGMDPEVEAAVRAALDELARAGATHRQGLAAQHEVRDRDLLPHLHRRGVVEPGALRRRSLRPPRGGRASLEELYTKTRGEGFGAEPKRRIMLGTYVLRAGYYEAYYGKALRARRKLADDFTRRVRGVRRDRHADVAGAGVQVRRAHGRPAADVPGRRAHRGAQPGRRPGAVAAVRLHEVRAAHRPADHRPALGEEICFRVAGAYEARTDWHTRRPPEAAT